MVPDVDTDSCSKTLLKFISVGTIANEPNRVDSQLILYRGHGCDDCETTVEDMSRFVSNPLYASAKDISEFIGSLGDAYADYKPLFIRNGIDGEVLHGLMNLEDPHYHSNKLLRGIDIRNDAHQLVIFLKIQKLFSDSSNGQMLKTSKRAATLIGT